MEDCTNVILWMEESKSKAAEASLLRAKSGELKKQAQEMCSHPATKTTTVSLEDDYGRSIGYENTVSCAICEKVLEVISSAN